MFTRYQMDMKNVFLNSYLNEDAYQDVPYDLYDMLLTDFPTHMKDGKVVWLDGQDVVLNVVPLQMIVSDHVPKKRAKDNEIQKMKLENESLWKVKLLCLKGKLVQTSDFKIDDEEYILDILATIRTKVRGTRILVNVPFTTMDNFSFHSKTSVHK